MIAKRGVKIEAVYFHAPPYTSERAKQKVVDLAKLVARYSGPIRLHVVNFTDIQLYIYDQCPHEELTIIMRRYMMRIAEHFARKDKCLGLITGESIGQVASQTLQSLAATDEVCELPVYRPVIGFDKEEIVQISRKINTFETSIQPFEDCCTIFVAKHPVTKPNLKVIHRSEEKLNEKIDQLMEEAMKLANKIAKGPLNCYTMSKALMNKAHETTFEELLKEETAMQAAARMNPNAEEGLSAFLEKRKASFQ